MMKQTADRADARLIRGALGSIGRWPSRRVTALLTGAAGVAAGIVLSAQQPPPPQAPPPIPAILQSYKTVTAERLKHPADDEWLMVRRTYDGWGFSPLAQINAANVARLQPVWSFATGVISGHEATPIVNNGVMFVSTPGNQVIAIDAKTGDAALALPESAAADAILLHPTSRGVALYGDKVFFAQAEAVLVALDAKTGKQVWSATGRRQPQRLLHVAGAAGRRRQGDGRRVGRRARRARIRRGLRRRDRQAGCGRRSPCRRRASRAARPGRRAISGRPAAARSG